MISRLTDAQLAGWIALILIGSCSTIAMLGL